jgi:hypothetical protein
VLFQSAYKQLGTIDADAMRVAEPEDVEVAPAKISQQKVAELAA